MSASRRSRAVLALTTLVVVLASTGAGAAPKTQQAFSYGNTSFTCDVADGSTCTRAQSADASTGIIDVQASITSPDGGTTPGQGYQGAGGRVANWFRLKKAPAAITATVTFSILPGTEVRAPTLLSYANNGIGVQIFSKSGSVVCNVSEATYAMESTIGTQAYQGPAELQATVTLTTCKDGETVVPLPRGSYQAVAYVWTNEWLGCRFDPCLEDTGTVSTRIVAQATELSVTTT